MKKIAISEFRAKCFKLIELVEKTKRPIRISRFGKPVAEITPTAALSSVDWLGSMKDEMEILGDIVSPAHNP